MAAGLGFKTFTTGEVLTAADTNGYLMQGVLVFASAAARDAAITSPQEGQFAYLKDTNVTTYYTGAAWANLDTTGMTNPMTTTGDIVYASSGSTPGRIGIGSTGNVLTVAGGIPSWAAPAGGGKVLQVVTATSTTSRTVATAVYTDTTLTASISPTAATSKILVLVNQKFVNSRNTQNTDMGIKLFRDATEIYAQEYYTNNYTGATAVQTAGYAPMSYVDSPATTSSTTYKTQGAMTTTNASATVTFQSSSGVSTITLLEIGA